MIVKRLEPTFLRSTPLLLGIRGDMVYDKTDTETDVFHDVVCALQSKTLELCEISISEGANPSLALAKRSGIVS